MQYPSKDLFSDEMSFHDFIILLSGIMPETPLGKIIQIRAETDPEIIKHFTPEQKKIKDEWQTKMNDLYLKTMTKEEKENEIRKIQNTFAQMFG